jgi:hypothetical protein
VIFEFLIHLSYHRQEGRTTSRDIARAHLLDELEHVADDLSIDGLDESGSSVYEIQSEVHEVNVCGAKAGRQQIFCCLAHGHVWDHVSFDGTVRWANPAKKLEVGRARGDDG